MDYWRGFQAHVRLVGRFALYCLRRFFADSCPRIASTLSYSTLLAIVPLFAIAFSLLSHLPGFEGYYDEVLGYVLANFLPGSGLQVSDQFGLLLENARKVTGFGILALVVTAYLMLVTLNSAFSGIWRAAPRTSLLRRLIMQWVIVTLWPVAVALSISLSSYGFAALRWLDIEDNGHLFGLTEVIPVVLALLAFAALYIAVSPRRIVWSHALAGAAVAAFLFESLRWGFGLYLEHFPSYEAIYGALATIPIFLVWIYLCWTVVLFGAEVTAAWPEWRRGEPQPSR